MKIWSITAPGSLEEMTILDAPVPKGYAKIRIIRAGISMTDIQIFQGALGVQYPVVPCHQAVGIISEIDETDSAFSKGQRVFISPYLPCGKCLSCNNDNPAFCFSMSTMGISAPGLLGNFVVVPIDNLFELPLSVHDEEAVFVDNVAVALRIFQDLKVGKGDYLAIAGASLIGITLSQIALYYQAIPIVVDNSDVRINLARTAGAYYVINSSTENPVERIMQITGGRGCECVSYLVNGSEPLQHAFSFASFGGRVSLTGWDHVTQAQNASMTTMISKQLTVFGINNGFDFMTSAINLLANGAVNVHPMLGRAVEFSDIPTTFRSLATGSIHAEKILVKM